MELHPKAPKSVVAAGLVAIIGSLLTGLVACFGLVMFVGLAQRPEAIIHRTSFQFEWYCATLLAAATYGVFVGVGLLRLRNWARISALIWAPVAIVGSTAFIVVLFSPTFGPPSTLIDGGRFWVIFRLSTTFVFAVPLAVGIWWLILFNRREIVLEFWGAVREAPASPIAAPTDESLS